MKYKHLIKILSRKYGKDLAYTPIGEVTKILTEKEFSQLISAMESNVCKNEYPNPPVADEIIFNGMVLDLLLKLDKLNLNINKEIIFDVFLKHSLSIGTEIFDKTELFERVDDDLRKVLATKFAEFKILDAPPSLN